jgi:abhydrolase domain-containing protein 6
MRGFYYQDRLHSYGSLSRESDRIFRAVTDVNREGVTDMSFMKHQPLFRLIFIGFILITLPACSGFKHRVYDLVMGMERRKAGVEPAVLEAGDFEVSLCEGPGRGVRPTLVMVHGFGANKAVWYRLCRHLKEDFHLIAVDLPGHGESSKHMDKDYSLSSQTLYFRAILQELKVEKPYLAGNSMGGAIIALYAALYPDDTGGVVLFNPGGIRTHGSELERYLAKGENPLIVKTSGDLQKLMDFSMEKPPFLPWPITSVMAEKAVANQEMHDKIFKDLLQNRAGGYGQPHAGLEGKTGAEADASCLHLWGENDQLVLQNKGHAFDDFEDVLRAIRSPTLIVWGRNDRLINVENGKVFNELIPDSRLVILEAVGHSPMLEVPEKAAGLLAEFIWSINDK